MAQIPPLHEKQNHVQRAQQPSTVAQLKIHSKNMSEISGGSEISQTLGGHQRQRGALTFYLAKFCRKLHENEENGPSWGAHPNFRYVDPSLRMTPHKHIIT